MAGISLAMHQTLAALRSGATLADAAAANGLKPETVRKSHWFKASGIVLPKPVKMHALTLQISEHVVAKMTPLAEAAGIPVADYMSKQINDVCDPARQPASVPAAAQVAPVQAAASVVSVAPPVSGRYQVGFVWDAGRNLWLAEVAGLEVCAVAETRHELPNAIVAALQQYLAAGGSPRPGPIPDDFDIVFEGRGELSENGFRELSPATEVVPPSPERVPRNTKREIEEIRANLAVYVSQFDADDPRVALARDVAANQIRALSDPLAQAVPEPVVPTVALKPLDIGYFDGPVVWPAMGGSVAAPSDPDATAARIAELEAQLAAPGPEPLLDGYTQAVQRAQEGHEQALRDAEQFGSVAIEAEHAAHRLRLAALAKQWG